MKPIFIGRTNRTETSAGPGLGRRVGLDVLHRRAAADHAADAMLLQAVVARVDVVTLVDGVNFARSFLKLTDLSL
jgi:hypothetical protein